MTDLLSSLSTLHSQNLCLRNLMIHSSLTIERFLQKVKSTTFFALPTSILSSKFSQLYYSLVTWPQIFQTIWQINLESLLLQSQFQSSFLSGRCILPYPKIFSHFDSSHSRSALLR